MGNKICLKFKVSMPRLLNSLYETRYRRMMNSIYRSRKSIILTNSHTMTPFDVPGKQVF